MSSMHPVNHASSAEPLDVLSNQKSSVENAEFLQRTSATQECGQKVIAEIVQDSQKSLSSDSDDADLAIFGDMLSFTAQTEEGERLENEGAEVVGEGVIDKAASQVEKLESIEEIMESSKLMDLVVVITNILEDKVAVVEGKGLEGSHLKGAFENNQVAVIHIDKLYVHPSAGLTHGQKVTLTDGRTLTVQHFTNDLWQKLSNTVMNYITQLSTKENGDDGETVKKEHATLPVKVKVNLNPHHLNRKNVQGDDRTREVREINRDNSLEKQIEKGVAEARILAHLTSVVSQIIEKHIIKIEDQIKKFDDHHRDVLLETLKTEHNVRPIPQALLGHA